VPCSKRITDLNIQESKEQEVEDGWVATDNPNSSTGVNSKKPETMDSDDMDMDNIIDGGE
jgi:hypothetical protein